ncbi:hypothetical protein CMO84_03000 [Candidatus Woesearchaeota archaeon]|jgi:pectin methylesterase-like acyl-CoA thioesterase|nr:hypothetical protein [Candidatus Woesearchaeota archaeon]
MTQLNSTSTVLALLLPLLLGTLTAHAAASDLHVDDDGMDYPNADYTSIQDAVDAACLYDTIYVHAGTYTGTGSEVVRMYKKTIDLVADSTYGDVIIDGELWRRGMPLPDAAKQLGMQPEAVKKAKNRVTALVREELERLRLEEG